MPGTIVAKREGQAIAASLGVTYAECSSLLSDGVQQALNTAVELTSRNPQRRSATKGFFQRKGRKSNSGKENEPVPPVMPPAGTCAVNNSYYQHNFDLQIWYSI